MSSRPFFFGESSCLTADARKRHLQRQKYAAWASAAAATRDAVILTNRTASNHDADRFADDCAENLTAARTF